MIKVTLTDWLCHESMEIEIDQVGLIVGPNGSGKTAIRDALEFLYLGTGQLRGIGTKKELGRLSIRDGAKTCTVKLEIGDQRLWRDMKRDGTQKLHRSARADGVASWSEPEEIAARRDGKSQIGGLAADALRVILEPTAFYALPSERRREMLIGATTDAEKPQSDSVEEALTAALHAESDADRQAIKQAAEWVSAGGFRDAEAKTVEARKQAKRDLGELVEVTLPEVDEATRQSFETHSLADYEKRLEEVRDHYTEAVAAEASGVANVAGQLEEAQSALTAVEDSEYEKPDQTAMADNTAAEKAAQEAREAHDQMSSVAAGLRLTIEKLSIDHFDRPAKCPAVSFEMKCPVKMATFEKLFDEHRGGSRKELADKQQQHDLAIEQLATLEADLDAAKTLQAETAARQTAELARVGREMTTIRAIDDARKRVAELKAKLASEQERARTPAEVGHRHGVGELRERVQLGVLLVTKKRAYDEATQATETYQTDLQNLTDRIERWDQIAQALKPDGIEAKLGGDARGDFAALLAEANPLARVGITDEFELLCMPAGFEKTRHPLQLSTSQRLACGISIQHALARLINFPILCTDAIDLFDHATRQAWSHFARKIHSDYAGAVIGLATVGAMPETAPEGITSYWIGNGKPEKIQEQEHADADTQQ